MLSASHGNLVAEEHIRMLAESGDLARAEQEADKLKLSLLDSNETLHNYWYAQASISRAKGNFDAAVRLFARASQDWSYRHRYMQAVSHIENRQYRSAIDLLKVLLGSERYTATLYVAKDVKLHYYLGIAYESAEMYEEASEQYRTFIDYWKDADTVIESIEDAKRRIERIAASS
jgi:tetratricopeptide (TPR) repeat protein